MKTQTPQTADDAYLGHHLHAMGLLEDIRDLLRDAPAPSESTNWGHVGSMEEIARQLAAVRDFVRSGNVYKNMDAKQFQLICDHCHKTADHLVWHRTEQDRATRLPYIQCHRRCLACGFEQPTVEEVARHA